MDPLLVDRADGVVTLTMNRPDAMNALDVPLKEALRDTLAAVSTDPSVRAVVLTGSGTRAFCVGQDLREHVGFLQSDSDMPLRTVTEHYNPIALALGSLPLPVVAAVRGAAAGAGASLALLADFRVGGPSTNFLMAFARVGLAGDTGASWILPRLVGHAKATELLMLADVVRADEAYKLGLLTKLVEDDDAILATAQEFALRLAAGPTRAYAAIKRELVEGAIGSLAEALAMEAEAQAECGATADHREGTFAFVEKRPPAYSGA